MAAQARRAAEVRTERLIEELLSAQGWDLRRPPNGDLLAQQEYKDHPALREALATASKSGTGNAGVPEYVLVNRKSHEPLAVFEGKARANQIDDALREVEAYGDALRAGGFSPLVVAVAGTSDARFEVRVRKWSRKEWRDVTYEGKPITWIPDPARMALIRADKRLFELRPEIPPLDVLQARAEEINGLLRESGLKDDFRPAAIGAIMLALWKSHGNLRREPKYILADINTSCEQAFWEAKKIVLAKSLHVDEANEKLATRAGRICQILERLNITTLTAEHDYLGTLYEEFFRYTGGNTIGQYFTPRHITNLMADLCEIDHNDIVLDPACGTGGFLVAAMDRMQRASKLPREQIIARVAEHLIGLEAEPVTAALCVANMILRGDGTTGVKRADCFDDREFPFEGATVVLMNPPFPHRKTDEPPSAFIDRALQGLRRRGLAAVVVPSSLLVKRPVAEWRREVLRTNTLRAVISLPTELFQPYAAATTAILLFEHGVPHAPNRPVFFCSVDNDGLRLKKGVRVPQPGSQMEAVAREFGRMGSVPEFCGPGVLNDDSGWAPGAYIAARPLTDEESTRGISGLVRNRVAFVSRHAPDLTRMLDAVDSGKLKPRRYVRAPRGARVPRDPAQLPTVIGDLFDIYYGQKSLHSKEGLEPGLSLVISSSGMDNGCYGFFDFADVLEPPFVTVPSTGSIGEASVQEHPCGVTDDCLLLMPKASTPHEVLYVAAATLRRERWRFDYGRKMTPERIAGFPLRMDPALLEWVRGELEKATTIEEHTMEAFAPARERKPTGVEPETLKLEMSFEEAVSRATKPSNPPGGVPERTKRKYTRKPPKE